MTFKVIDRKTGKEPTSRVLDNIAKKGGLMLMDIDQFFVGEDGELVLADDCGNITYCDTKRFEVIAEQEPKTGHWIPRNSFLLQYKCSECGWESEKYNFCPNCGTKMSEIQTGSER